MWKNNRPEGWKNSIREEADKLERKEGKPTELLRLGAEVFESGADAMLEALEKEANGKALWFDRTDSKDLLIYVAK